MKSTYTMRFNYSLNKVRAGTDCLHRPRIPDEWPENQKDIVRQMLRKQPTHRIHMFILRVSYAGLTRRGHQWLIHQEHPWVTDDGANPMIARDDNLYHVGKFVEEPTQEELSSAIGTLRGVL